MLFAAAAVYGAAVDGAAAAAAVGAAASAAALTYGPPRGVAFATPCTRGQACVIPPPHHHRIVVCAMSERGVCVWMCEYYIFFQIQMDNFEPLPLTPSRMFLNQ